MIYGHIATATGWTFREIDALTMWDVIDLFEYWQESPPTHVLVAAYLLGNKKRPRGKGKPGSTSGGFEELATAVHLAGGGVLGKLPACYRTAEVWQAGATHQGRRKA